MRKLSKLLVAVAVMTLLFSRSGKADVPAPPVNQTIGMEDIYYGTLEEADCRLCHDSGVPDRHHMLYGQPIYAYTVAPFPDADGDGQTDDGYVCLSCHGQAFAVERDCTVCHSVSPHHDTPAAASFDCKSCHGDLVDNPNDGHYIPTYAPSLVTPAWHEGQGLPVNSRGNGAGACDYCHDADTSVTPEIGSIAGLHHDATPWYNDPGSQSCEMCHDFSNIGGEIGIRVCEGCHGPESLHNIQADSLAPANIGDIVVGGEEAGYGHVGRDAGPGDSDCWGCHGFAMPAMAPFSGPIIPTVYGSDLSVTKSGTDTVVILNGSAFTNTAGSTLFESNVALTGADGSSVTLSPNLIEEGQLAVTIPADTTPGNYKLRAVKTDDAGDPVASNPVPVSIVPEVIISEVTSGESVTINGSGFGGYAQGSGTSVTGTITIGKGKKSTTATVEATILSWSDTQIEAAFDSNPSEVTVNSVFGAASSEVVIPPKNQGKGHNK